MKNQSLILKMLGVAFVAILAWALYDISDQNFGYYRDRNYSNEAEVEVGMYIYQALPYLLLLAFFVFLKKDYPDSKSANYAFWISVVGVSLIVLGFIFQYAGEVKIEAFEKLNRQMHSNDTYDADTMKDKWQTVMTLSMIGHYLLLAKVLIVFAVVLVADTLRKNKRLLLASLFVLVSLLLSRFVSLKYCHDPFGEYQPALGIYNENCIILNMVKTTLCMLSFAYLFYTYSQKDAPQVVKGSKYSRMEWGTVIGVCLTTVFFFSNWIDYESIASRVGTSDLYMIIGCHAVPTAALGLIFMPIAIFAILERNDIAKKISAIALIVWPFVVGIATWNFELFDGKTVSDILREGKREVENFNSEFTRMTDLHEIVLYTVSSIASGLLILLSMRKEKPSVEEPRKLNKDEEIARLKAELEALKSQMKIPDTPVSEE